MMAEDLVLRALQEADLPGLTAIANLPGVRRGTLRLPFTTEADMRARFLDGAPDRHVIVAVRAESPVGWGALFRHGGRRAHAGEVVLAVHDEFWGRGIGRRLLGALLDIADNWLGLTRIELEVLVENARAIALYQSLGFAREGTKRGDILCDGVLEDSHVMARLRPAPVRRAEVAP